MKFHGDGFLVYVGFPGLERKIALYFLPSSFLKKKHLSTSRFNTASSWTGASPWKTINISIILQGENIPFGPKYQI